MLVHNNPGSLIVIDISNDDIQSCHESNKPYEINLKKLYLKLTGQKSINSSDRIANLNEERVSGVYENIIEKLEKKYYSQSSLLSDEDISLQESVNSDNGTRNDDDNEDSLDTMNRNSKQKQKFPIDDYDEDDPFIDDSEKIDSIENEIKMVNTRTKHRGFFVSSGKLELLEKDEFDQRKALKEQKIKSKENETNNKSNKLNKPSWEPCEEVIAALEKFKVFVNENKVELTKNSNLPTNYEIPLLELDKIVQSRHGKIVHKTLGYYEYLSDVLGNEVFGIGKIKKLLGRLHQKESAMIAHRDMMKTLNSIENQIKVNIFPCPESMQPSQNSQNTPGASELTSSLIDKIDNIMSQLSDVTATQSEASTPTASLPSSPPPPPIRYEWYCRWSIPMRGLLIELEALVGKWVPLENTYRQRLTSAEKYQMNDSEIEIMDEKEKFSEMIGDLIAKVFPTSCLHGDVPGVMKLLKLEKKRIRSKILKEKKLAEQASSEQGSGSVNPHLVRKNPPLSQESHGGGNNKRPRVDVKETIPSSLIPKKQISSIPMSHNSLPFPTSNSGTQLSTANKSIPFTVTSKPTQPGNKPQFESRMTSQNQNKPPQWVALHAKILNSSIPLTAYPKSTTTIGFHKPIQHQSASSSNLTSSNRPSLIQVTPLPKPSIEMDKKPPENTSSPSIKFAII